MSQLFTFHFVQLWQENHQHTPTVQERVLAPSEGYAVVQVMKEHHLHAASRAWVSRSALDAPTMRLTCVIVKGNHRSWKLDITPLGERRS